MSATAADLLDTAPCGVFSVDVATSRILYANAAAARITARSREALVGTTVTDLFTIEFEPMLTA
ncbi:PAS domain-containing protein [Rhodococcus sp. BS-15]|nr:PAS domain-containing protein [Rhodococcus sp. BS-15]